jgi:hypothetical protein
MHVGLVLQDEDHDASLFLDFSDRCPTWEGKMVEKQACARIMRLTTSAA